MQINKKRRSYLTMQQFFYLILINYSFISSLTATVQASRDQIAFCKDGSQISIWQANDDGANSIQTSLFPAPSGPWSTASTISTPGENSFNPQLCVNNNGNSIVGWFAENTAYATYLLKVRTIPVGSMIWNPPVTISSTDQQILSFNIKVDEVSYMDTITITYNTLESATNTSAVWTVKGSFGGSWDSPIQLH